MVLFDLEIFLIICQTKIRKGPKKAFKAIARGVGEMAPRQQATPDKYVFIPEASSSDRILLIKYRTYILKFLGGMKGNKGMGSAAFFMDIYIRRILLGAYF